MSAMATMHHDIIPSSSGFPLADLAVSLALVFVIGGADVCVCFVTPCLTAVIFHLYNIIEACPCSSDG